MVDILERLRSPQTSLGTLWPQPNLHEEAADEITRLRAEIAEANVRLDDARRGKDIIADWFDKAAAERDALREENARLRELLKPFVPETQWIDPAIPDTRPIDVMVLAGELRAARAAILGKVKAEAACPAPDEAP